MTMLCVVCRVVMPYLSIGQVAQSVEQRTENPCVGGSIPPLATNKLKSKAEDSLPLSSVLLHNVVMVISAIARS